MPDIDKAVEDIVGLEWILTPTEPQCEQCKKMLAAIEQRKTEWERYVEQLTIEYRVAVEEGILAGSAIIKRCVYPMKGENSGNRRS